MGAGPYGFKDKVAVITGAGSGIGRALAQLLAGRGCRLALADIDEESLRETAAGLPAEVLTHALDVANRAAVYGFADAVKQRFGTAHVVVNNAGVALTQSVNEMTWDDFEWLMGINFWGVTYGTKAFLPMLLAQNEGAIVNLSSVFGLIAVPTQSAYNAAKFAVRGFTEALRHELKDTGVRAISVHPGGIRTNIVRDSRFYKDPFGRTDKARVIDRFEKMAKTTPEQAAATIVRGIEKGSPRVLIGGDAVMIDKLQRLMPVSYGRVVNAMMERLDK
jgi:NAD(P)-dependent dehydrogenase (short-subunit alcohol dehydrogenase family)